MRNTDPKAVQEKVTSQAKEAQATVQAKVTEVIGSFDSDLRKLGENAQDLALRSLGVAAEYAVRARETYEKVAERGEQTVKHWRGETADEIVEIAVVVEPRKESKPHGHHEGPASTAKPGQAKAAPAPKPAPKPAKPESKAPAAPAGKAPARKPAAKKTTPPSAK